MKELIEKLISEKPKHYAKIIKNNSELYNWVIRNSSVADDKIFPEKIYSAITQKSNLCHNGNELKFGDIKMGYRFCGKAGVCQCANASVSKKVSEKKASRTRQEIDEENKKREQTNLAVYGVSNTGQTVYAKQKHKELYNDLEKSKGITQNIIETLRERYGTEVTNARHIPGVNEQIIDTVRNRYGVDNVLVLPENREKSAVALRKRSTHGEHLRMGYDRFSSFVEREYGFTLLTPFENYYGIRQKDAHEYIFKCNTCDEIIPKSFIHSAGINCYKCNPRIPSWVSKEEQKVYDFVTSLGVIGYQSDKRLINPFEIDMVFPEEKLAIEYCGLYWHSELSSGKKRSYHITKHNKMKELGYQLVTIFSDEWLYQQDIVHSRLKHMFNKNQSIPLYAKNLLVHDISREDAKIFLETFHLQGYAEASTKLGLYDKDKLVAVMTFSLERSGYNKKSTSDNPTHELIRYATNGDRIVGGAGKLLQHFIRKVQPNRIVTSADRRWSDGNLYRTLGFKEISISEPNCWYVENYKFRSNRYNHMPYMLIDLGFSEELSGWENMQVAGYDRIHDCGNINFEMQLNYPK